MTGKPTDPNDANHTTPYDPPPEPPPTPPEPPETPAPPPETPEPPQTPAPPPETTDLRPAALAPDAPPATTPPSPAPRWRSYGNEGRTGTIVFGVILVAIGLWFFGDQTLGLDMPELSWSELWPILIIGLGAWVVLGSLRRDA